MNNYLKAYLQLNKMTYNMKKQSFGDRGKYFHGWSAQIFSKDY